MKQKSLLKLFSEKGPLKFIAMDILGPLQKKKSGFNYVLVIADR